MSTLSKRPLLPSRLGSIRLARTLELPELTSNAVLMQLPFGPRSSQRAACLATAGTLRLKSMSRSKCGWTSGLLGPLVPLRTSKRSSRRSRDPP